MKKYKVTFKKVKCYIRCTPYPDNFRGIFSCLDCKQYDEVVEAIKYYLNLNI